MSIGLARDAGGGFQQVLSFANTSRMLSTCAGWACTHVDDISSSAAAIPVHDLRSAATAAYLMSDAAFPFPILSGSTTGSPRFVLSTTSMPDTTSPTTVYLPFSDEPSANMMKNCEFAELGSLARAMPTMPRLNGTLENSAGTLGYFEPPVPLKFLPSPVCAMKP